MNKDTETTTLNKVDESLVVIVYKKFEKALTIQREFTQKRRIFKRKDGSYYAVLAIEEDEDTIKASTRSIYNSTTVLNSKTLIDYFESELAKGNKPTHKVYHKCYANMVHGLTPEQLMNHTLTYPAAATLDRFRVKKSENGLRVLSAELRFNATANREEYVGSEICPTLLHHGRRNYKASEIVKIAGFFIPEEYGMDRVTDDLEGGLSFIRQCAIDIKSKGDFLTLDKLETEAFSDVCI